MQKDIVGEIEAKFFTIEIHTNVDIDERFFNIKYGSL